jgi:hypothetical protein
MIYEDRSGSLLTYKNIAWKVSTGPSNPISDKRCNMLFVLSLSNTRGDRITSNHDLVLVFTPYWPERMSESPASRMAIVEQRKSLPQAVPSSICRLKKKSPVSHGLLPSKAWILRLLLRVAPRTTYFCAKSRHGAQEEQRGRGGGMEIKRLVELTLLPEKWWTGALASMA